MNFKHPIDPILTYVRRVQVKFPSCTAWMGAEGNRLVLRQGRGRGDFECPLGLSWKSNLAQSEAA